MRTASRFLLLSGLSVLAVSSFANSVSAAGFYIQEQSVSGLGNAFAGSAAQPRDASVLFFNPAGMTHLEGGNANLGVHVLIPRAKMKDTGTTLPAGAPASSGDGGNPYDPTPVPNAYITQQMTDYLWLGFGISAPFGLGSEYNNGWFGRYDSTKTELKTIDFAPSIAVKPHEQLSVGASLIVQYADAKLQNNIFGATEGLQTLDGDSIAYGWKLGVLAEPVIGTRIGIDYRSKMTQKLEGRLKIEGTGVPALTTDIVGKADLKLPDIATFSVAHDLNDRWTLMGSATWFGWSAFNRIDVKNQAGTTLSTIPQGYQNTWAFSAGFDYKASESWTLRAGYQFDETPTVDEFRTSRTPDGDRHWFSGGATYTLNDRWSFDFAATYINVADEKINLRRNIDANPSQFRADTEGYVAILAAGVNYRF
ncbi:MAG: OmpP1/FadL family transporter [Alphaproteobacteria bacterium]